MRARALRCAARRYLPLLSASIAPFTVPLDRHHCIIVDFDLSKWYSHFSVYADGMDHTGGSKPLAALLA
jgi:hypothetical protein